MREQLLQAREILETGLQNVSYARKVVALTDGKSIADIGWVKVNTYIIPINKNNYYINSLEMYIHV